MTTASGESGSATTQVLVPSSVIGEAFGASTHSARAVAHPPTAARGCPGVVPALTAPHRRVRYG